LVLWVALSSAGICEEAVYRIYLQKQFIALTRNVPAGIILSRWCSAALTPIGISHASVMAGWAR
jgi:membrane protease YdiL (CAAX protease family)